MRAEPPRFLFFQTNRRCNLRCLHCDFWKDDDSGRERYLPWPRRDEILEEFAEMGGQTVVTCGGEPMLDTEDYFRLTSKSRSLGLKCFSVINGTRVHTPAKADRMMAEGPSEITVSLNSHLEEEHDRTRGVKGSFKVAVKALKLLLEARQRAKVSTKIYAMTIVHEHNYRQLGAFYDFVLNELGADKLKLNILQPSFGVPTDDDFFATEQVRDVDALVRVLEECNTKYNLHLNPEWTRQVAMYFRSTSKAGLVTIRKGWRSPVGTEEAICNSYDRNIMLDLHGVARLCFAQDFGQMAIQKRGDLRAFWYGASLKWRHTMVGCKRYCGISHSVRRVSATISSSSGEATQSAEKPSG